MPTPIFDQVAARHDHVCDLRYLESRLDRAHETLLGSLETRAMILPSRANKARLAAHKRRLAQLGWMR